MKVNGLSGEYWYCPAPRFLVQLLCEAGFEMPDHSSANSCVVDSRRWGEAQAVAGRAFKRTLVVRWVLCILIIAISLTLSVKLTPGIAGLLSAAIYGPLIGLWITSLPRQLREVEALLKSSVVPGLAPRASRVELGRLAFSSATLVNRTIKVVATLRDDGGAELVATRLDDVPGSYRSILFYLGGSSGM